MMTRKRITSIAFLAVAAGAAVTFVYPALVGAHCQVPCGIYGDEARFTAMREHVTTIEKSMKQIKALSDEKPANYNQIVRWVNNKDGHASELTEIATYYFLAQRIKPVSPDDAKAHKKYLSKLELLHGIVYRSMKAKQTTDPDHVAELRKLIDAFEKLYKEK
jgi:nickel superoxide dismutase